MWISALETWHDKETNYLFFPEKVAEAPREKVQKDLTKHKLALQKNRHTDIWMAIGKALRDLFDSDPRRLLGDSGWDVVRIHQVIQEDKKKSFPYLSGPKMANYWLYILSCYTDARFTNMQEISIIPDTHVLQCTVRLGLCGSLPNPLMAAKLWKELLDGSGLAPVQMHPVLWNWSRNNFKPEV